MHQQYGNEAQAKQMQISVYQRWLFSEHSFHIGDTATPSLCEQEQKFPGKLFFSDKSEEAIKLVGDTLQEAMENIETSLIRPKYKLWILKNYLYPSKRFLLTVHTLTQTHLNIIVDKRTKKVLACLKARTLQSYTWKKHSTYKPSQQCT